MLPGADGNAVITWLLLAINIIVWLLMQLTAGSVNTDVSILLRFRRDVRPSHCHR